MGAGEETQPLARGTRRTEADQAKGGEEGAAFGGGDLITLHLLG